MPKDFCLIDLISQAGAVRRIFAGMTEAEKLEWLASRGKLEPVVKTPDGRRAYHFESSIKREANFFFDKDDLVFLGDHTTFTVGDE